MLKDDLVKLIADLDTLISQNKEKLIEAKDNEEVAFYQGRMEAFRMVHMLLSYILAGKP